MFTLRQICDRVAMLDFFNDARKNDIDYTLERQGTSLRVTYLQATSVCYDEVWQENVYGREYEAYLSLWEVEDEDCTGVIMRTSLSFDCPSVTKAKHWARAHQPELA